MEPMQAVILLVITALTLYVYVLPGYIAKSKGHPSANAILLLNIAFGWTVIGYFGALIWSLTNPPKP